MTGVFALCRGILLTLSNIEQKLTSHYRPAVLRGFAKDWPIVKEAHKSDKDVKHYLASLAGN
jgi:hypothetical protein